MICVHRLRGEPFWLNYRLIKTMESNPDTVVTLNNDNKYIINESPEQVIQLIMEFESQIKAFISPKSDKKSMPK